MDIEKEYLRFKSDNEFLHRYIYRSFYGQFDESNEIHHIDANHYNNEIWNLIELSHDNHKKLKHARITYGDWMSGIEELRKIGLSDKDFPKEVIKKLRN
ncbi:MAG: HNH endonuclease [archaeon]